MSLWFSSCVMNTRRRSPNSLIFSSMPELQHLFILVLTLTSGGQVRSHHYSSMHSLRVLENVANMDVDWLPEGFVVFSCARDAVYTFHNAYNVWRQNHELLHGRLEEACTGGPVSLPHYVHAHRRCTEEGEGSCLRPS